MIEERFILEDSNSGQTSITMVQEESGYDRGDIQLSHTGSFVESSDAGEVVIKQKDIRDVIDHLINGREDSLTIEDDGRRQTFIKSLPNDRVLFYQAKPDNLNLNVNKVVIHNDHLNNILRYMDKVFVKSQ